MAEEILELVARLRPEGAKETEDALQGAREEFEETADTVGESADDLEGFAQKFEGALGVAVAGLAVATGGLLSTVPVIGEALGAVGAFLEAVGFQVDQFLRDIGAGGVTQAIFDLANAIFKLDGVAADVFGALSTVAVAIAGVKTAALALGALASGSGVLATFATAILAIGSAITSALAAVPLAIALVVGAIAALIAIIFNIGGARDFAKEAFNAIVGFLGDLVTNGWNFAKIAIETAITAIKGFIDSLATKAKNKFNDIKSDVTTILGAVPDLALGIFSTLFSLAIAEIDFGKKIIVSLLKKLANSIIAAFEGGLNLAGDAVEAGINNILSTIQSGVNKGIEQLNRLPNVDLEKVGLASVNIGEVSAGRFQRESIASIKRQRQERRSAAARDINDQLLSVLERLADERAKPPTIEINGREVATGTARFINEETNARGRFS